MKSTVFLSIQPLADIAARFLRMTAAGADAFRQIGRQFVGVDFPDTAAHGDFVAVVYLIVDQTHVDLVHLQQKIADQAQNVGIAGLRMYYRKTVFIVVAVADHGDSGDHQLLQGQVGIAKHSEQSLVGVKSFPHVHIPGIMHLRKLVGVCVQAVIQRRTQHHVLVHRVVFLQQHGPYQRTAAAQIGLYAAHRHIFNLYTVMVYHRHLLRLKAGYIARPVLAIHGDQKAREGRMPLPFHILYWEL